MDGLFTEWLVRRALKRRLPASHYTLFPNFVLPEAVAARKAPRGGRRIPLLLVSPYGVFVIDVVHQPGMVTGTEQQPRWTRSRFWRRQRFPNPLHRNQWRIHALRQLLGLASSQFHSVVVFTGSAEFPEPMPVNVTQSGGLVPFIQVRTEMLLGYDEAHRVAGLLASSRPPPGLQARAARLALLRELQGTRFGARPALAGLLTMVALLLLAGVLAGSLVNPPPAFPERSAEVNPFDPAAPPPRIELPRVAGSAARVEPAPALQAGTAPAGGVAAPAEPVASVPPERLAWEASLTCVQAAQSQRCACYEPSGRRAELGYEECRTLAGRERHVSQR
jgi:hypothetical protein